MTEHVATRRAMLGAIATLPAIGIAASAAQAQQGVSPALLAKIARWREAEADFGDSTALFEAHTAWKAACEKIPHTTFPPYKTLAGKPIVPTTSDRVHVAIAKSIVERPLSSGSPYEDVMRQLAKAWDEREAEKERLRGVYRLDELQQASDDACDHAGELMGEALRHPAQNIADVLHKLKIMDEVDQDGGYTREIVTADLQRLAAGRA